jgi:site-specific recombinase XerD
MNSIILRSSLETWPIAVATATPRAKFSILQFFIAELSNPNTRRSYLRAAEDFFAFVATAAGGYRLDGITSLHVATWLEVMKVQGLSPQSIKVRLAAVRMLFQALVREQILAVNPASVVRGPKHSVTSGKTPVLDGADTQRLLLSIDGSCAAALGQAPTRLSLIGLRDRAMIGTMAYSFARISAVTALKVGDVFRQKHRLWLRLAEKGGKSKDVPCHHQLEAFIAEWLAAAGHAEAPGAPLFQTFASAGQRVGNQRPLSGKPMSQAMTWEMIQRRANAAGIDTAICNHTFRATGITAYLSNGGTIERAAVIAGHASTRTTQLYDRRPDDVTLDEIEKIRFA